jgi:preprotein translocase subunit SecE
VADSKRRGRSDDDEFEDAELDEFDDQDELDDDALDEDDDLDEDGDEDDEEFDDDFDEDEDEEEAATTSGRSRTAARTKAAASTRSRTVTRPKTKAGTQRKKKRDDVGPGIIGRLVRFVREVVAELQKVNWPTRKELTTYTTVVVVFVAIMMTLVALLDLGFARAMFAVFGGTTTKATG